MGTTLRNIANELNLSVNTVSRGLRDMPDISKATRELIQSAAKQMGYQKNMAASSLRTKRSYILGVIVTDYRNPSNNQIINGVERVGNFRGYTVMVGATDNNKDSESSMVIRMLEQGVDGIILVPTMNNVDVLNIMEDSGTPYVLAARKYDEHESNYVYSDDKTGCAMVAEAFYNRGHRDFIYIASTLAEQISSIRYESFVGKLMELGLPRECVRLVYCDGTQMDARRAVGQWLDNFPIYEKLPVTGAFAFSDYSAFGCYMALKERGYQIPQNLSIIGYDNVEFAMMMDPGLCTVDNHFLTLGSGAAERLIEMINDPEERKIVKKNIVLPELVWRNSVRAI